MTYPSLLCLFLAAMGAEADNSTLAGRFVVEHPTLLNLGFEWEIRGDANRNATVTVEFRAVGESDSRSAASRANRRGEGLLVTLQRSTRRCRMPPRRRRDPPANWVSSPLSESRSQGYGFALSSGGLVSVASSFL